jgi:hypothetical protein
MCPVSTLVALSLLGEAGVRSIAASVSLAHAPNVCIPLRAVCLSHCVLSQRPWLSTVPAPDRHDLVSITHARS